MIEFRVLGSFEVLEDQRPVALGGPKQRALLAVLLLRRGEAVSSDRLIDALWGERAPASAAKIVQGYVSNLRKALGEGLLITRGHGYLLQTEPGQVDLERFEALATDGRRLLQAGDARAGTKRLRDALALWRGEPLADFAYEPFAQSEIARLDEARLAALEDRIDADLSLSDSEPLVGELEALVHQHPLRERLQGQLMLALYRSGRQADALESYRNARGALVDELGIEPGPALQQLERSILAQDPALAPPARSSLPRSAMVAPKMPHGGQLIAAGGAAAPASPALTRLPAPPTPTIGRQREADDVAALLLRADVRLVTLTGPGGVGKTRLALTIARELARRFRGGSWWVELAGLVAREHISPAVARALELTPLRGESTTDGLRRHLAGKELLLVLDNFEHVLESAPLVAELLDACPALKVLATSREPLNLAAEQRFAVAPLATSSRPDEMTPAEIETIDATALFTAAARRRDSRFTVTAAGAPAIARICEALDGLPLALELAAARTGLLSIEELTATLDHALKLGVGPRDAPARQQTLSATIDWSYRLLNDEQQAAFRRFAVFAGGATLEASQAVTGATLDTLQALTAKSVLERRQQADGITRLAMLATVRQYGLTKLATDTDQDAVRRQHCDYYRRVVEEAVPGLSTHQETIALARLDIEVDNIRAALHWALDAAPTSALRLAGHLGKYWYIRHDLDGFRWLDAALEAAGESAPVHDRARARLHQSIHLYLRDSYEAGLESANAALTLYQQAGDHAGMSNALREVAVGIGVLGETERWRELAQLALRHAELAGDTRTLGKALSALALVPGEDRARLLQQAAQHLTRVGDYGEIAMAYSNAAYTALTEGQVAEAASLLEVALDAVQRIDSPMWDEVIHANVGLTELFSGNLLRARRAFERHLQLCLDHAFVASGEGLAGMAAIAAHHGHYARAARIRGAARSAGYPPTPLDEPIDNRLERDFFATAAARHGVANWRSDEEAGASLSYTEAIEYALERPTAARNNQRIESLTAHQSEQRQV